MRVNPFRYFNRMLNEREDFCENISNFFSVV